MRHRFMQIIDENESIHFKERFSGCSAYSPFRLTGTIKSQPRFKAIDFVKVSEFDVLIDLTIEPD